MWATGQVTSRRYRAKPPAHLARARLIVRPKPATVIGTHGERVGYKLARSKDYTAVASIPQDRSRLRSANRHHLTQAEG